jgi:hypothetical protein
MDARHPSATLPNPPVDPEEPDGVSESAILHNEEACALYRRHAPSKRPRQRDAKVSVRVERLVGDKIVP